ncbi:unnamed protein product [Microthlaspi erraticum]|uniref:Uncharacterized protein n=1 Tax=Microthlaspi erraticum TaxID=1685480 RepID=A0A6D2HWH0_9BRAS|nr:unnamed protein product [Microthlaspi erraticum]
MNQPCNVIFGRGTPTPRTSEGGRVLRPLPGRTSGTIADNVDKEQQRLHKSSKSGSSTAHNASPKAEVSKSHVCGYGKGIHMVSGGNDHNSHSPPLSNEPTAAAPPVQGQGDASHASPNEDDLPISMLVKACAVSIKKKEIVTSDKRNTEIEVATGTGKEPTVSPTQGRPCAVEVEELEVAGSFKPFKQLTQDKVRAFRKTLSETCVVCCSFPCPYGATCGG